MPGEKGTTMKRSPATIVALSAFGVVACCVAFTVVSLGDAKENKKILQDFFGKLADGQGQDTYKQMHPSRQKNIDLVMFEQFAMTVNKELGKLNYVTIRNFEKQKGKDGVAIVATARGQFENGAATLEFNGILTKSGVLVKEFSISSPRLNNWFQLPKDRSSYQARSKSFAEALCNGQAQVAWDLMSGKLRKSVGEGKFIEQVKKTLAVLGPSKEVTLKSSRADGQTLIFTFTIRGQTTLEAMITVSFPSPSKLRGEITTYQMKPSKG